MTYLIIYFVALGLGLIVTALAAYQELIVAKEPRPAAKTDLQLALYASFLWPIVLVIATIGAVLITAEWLWQSFGPSAMIARARKRHHLEERIPVKDFRK